MKKRMTIKEKGLSELAKSAKEIGLSVLVFTGFLLEELEALENPDVIEFLKNIDALVDEPYQREAPDEERGLIGATNQRIYYFTDFFRVRISPPRESEGWNY